MNGRGMGKTAMQQQMLSQYGNGSGVLGWNPPAQDYVNEMQRQLEKMFELTSYASDFK